MALKTIIEFYVLTSNIPEAANRSLNINFKNRTVDPFLYYKERTIV
jgi:hypothetical protein